MNNLLMIDSTTAELNEGKDNEPRQKRSKMYAAWNLKDLEEESKWSLWYLANINKRMLFLKKKKKEMH